MEVLLEAMNEYRKAYFNAKLNNQLPKKMVVEQKIRSNDGPFGKGYYGKARLLDPNKEDVPKEKQFYANAALFATDKTTQEMFGSTDVVGNLGRLKEAGYLGVRYGEDKYFIFHDNLDLDEPEPQSKEDNVKDTEFSAIKMNSKSNATVTDKVSNRSYEVIRRDSRWRIRNPDGTKRDGEFRTLNDAVKNLESDYEFLK